jgi:hypothetical protein
LENRFEESREEMKKDCVENLEKINLRPPNPWNGPKGFKLKSSSPKSNMKQNLTNCMPCLIKPTEIDKKEKNIEIDVNQSGFLNASLNNESMRFLMDQSYYNEECENTKM